MATISVIYPDEYADDASAALRDFLGNDGDGLTDAAAAKKSIKRWVKTLVKSYRRRNAASVATAVVSADAALADKAAAAQTAIQARKDAEDAEEATIESAFGSDS